MGMQRGFALIELVIVIAVISILAGMAIPRLGNSLAEQELTSAAQQMVAELRYLQQITINADDQVYRMTFNGDQYYIANGYHILKTIKLPASVVIYGTPAAMTFRRFDGGTNTAQTIQLISTSLHKSLFIKIHPNKGRVRIDTVPGTEP